MNDAIIASAIKYIEEIFQNNADGHDASHSLRVYRNALQIAKKYPDCDAMVVSLAALLHDVDDHKLFQTENNANARRFLSGQGIALADVERICSIINGVSFSKNRGKTPETVEGKIVQDADRLDAIGAIGVARAFAYGGRCGRPIEMSLQHFHDKLLLLRDEMNTEVGKSMANGRHAFLEAFLDEIGQETNDGTDV